MPQYLVAIYHPDDYDPSVETEAMIENIHALNREMIAAGARKFACGLSPAGNAKSLRAQPDGKVLVTDGPYPRPRSTWAVFGYWKPLTWTRRWRGRARAPSPAARRARCARFFSTRTRRQQRNSLTRRDFGIGGVLTNSNEQSTHSSRLRYPHRRLWSGYGTRACCYAGGG